MPWKDSSLPKQRLSLIRAALAHDESISTLAKRLDLSRKTAHKWLARRAQSGLAGLQERSHAPNQPPHALPRPLVDRLIALRHAHPTWGARKLRTLRWHRACETPR